MTDPHLIPAASSENHLTVTLPQQAQDMNIDRGHIAVRNDKHYYDSREEKTMKAQAYLKFIFKYDIICTDVWSSKNVGGMTVLF